MTAWARCHALLSFLSMIAASWVHRHPRVAENRLLNDAIKPGAAIAKAGAR
jgi:hypothetical protein